MFNGYGELKAVAEHLQTAVRKYPFLKPRLAKEIKRYSKKVSEQEELNRLDASEDDEETLSKCYYCSWGDGEGGCVLPEPCDGPITQLIE